MRRAGSWLYPGQGQERGEQRLVSSLSLSVTTMPSICYRRRAIVNVQISRHVSPHPPVLQVGDEGGDGDDGGDGGDDVERRER